MVTNPPSETTPLTIDNLDKTTKYDDNMNMMNNKLDDRDTLNTKDSDSYYKRFSRSASSLATSVNSMRSSIQNRIPSLTIYSKIFIVLYATAFTTLVSLFIIYGPTKIVTYLLEVSRSYSFTARAITGFLLVISWVVFCLPYWILPLVLNGFMLSSNKAAPDIVKDNNGGNMELFWLAFLVNYAAVITASFIAISLGRFYLKARIRNWMKTTYPNLLKGMRMIERDATLVLLFRFFMMPLFIKNYASSTMEFGSNSSDYQEVALADEESAIIHENGKEEDGRETFETINETDTSGSSSNTNTNTFPIFILSIFLHGIKVSIIFTWIGALTRVAGKSLESGTEDLKPKEPTTFFQDHLHLIFISVGICISGIFMTVLVCKFRKEFATLREMLKTPDEVVEVEEERSTNASAAH